MQENDSSTPQPLSPLLWGLTGILLAGAFHNALQMTTNFIFTALLFLKSDFLILRMVVIVTSLITVGLDLVLVIWMVRNKGKIQQMSKTWIIAAMVVWPLCFVSNLFLTALQTPWYATFLEIRTFASLQKLKTAISLVQNLVYMGMVIGTVGYLWLQKRPTLK